MKVVLLFPDDFPLLQIEPKPYPPTQLIWGIGASPILYRRRLLLPYRQKQRRHASTDGTLKKGLLHSILRMGLDWSVPSCCAWKEVTLLRVVTLDLPCLSVLGCGSVTLKHSLKFYHINQEVMLIRDHKSLSLDAQYNGRRDGAVWFKCYARRCSRSSQSSSVLGRRPSPPTVSRVPYEHRRSSSTSTTTPLRSPHVQRWNAVHQCTSTSVHGIDTID